MRREISKERRMLHCGAWGCVSRGTHQQLIGRLMPVRRPHGGRRLQIRASVCPKRQEVKPWGPWHLRTQNAESRKKFPQLWVFLEATPALLCFAQGLIQYRERANVCVWVGRGTSHSDHLGEIKILHSLFFRRNSYFVWQLVFWFTLKRNWVLERVITTVTYVSNATTPKLIKALKFTREKNSSALPTLLFPNQTLVVEHVLLLF